MKDLLCGGTKECKEYSIYHYCYKHLEVIKDETRKECAEIARKYDAQRIDAYQGLANAILKGENKCQE